MIKEIIVVEGRDDEAAVKRAVEAETIATHGYGISRQTYERIDKAHKERGLIIFTDPDHAGDKIRRKLTEKYPDSKQAFLKREDAKCGEDIGIENAKPEAIIEALSKAKASKIQINEEFEYEDMIIYGLAGTDSSSQRRDYLGKELGIGYGNAKVFLNRLNQYGIKKSELETALRKLKG